MMKKILALAALLFAANAAAVNDYYTASGVPSTGAPLVSSTIRNEFAAIGTGFTKLPVLTGAGNAIVVVNPGGTALTTATVLTNGQLLIGNTGAVPTAASITGTANQITSTSGAGSITLSLPAAVTMPGSLTVTGAFTASPANANVTLSPTGTGTVTINPATLGNIDNTRIGFGTRAAIQATTGDFNNSVSVSGVLTVVASIAMTAANSGIELGPTNSANTPFIDFHSSGNNIDYDARIIASGGTGVAGNGTLTFTTATASFGGTLTTTGTSVVLGNAAGSVVVAGSASGGNNYSYVQSTGGKIGFWVGGVTNIVSDTTGWIAINTGHGFAGSGGVEQVRISHTGSAVNYINMTGGTAGNAPYIQSVGSNVGLRIIGSSGPIAFESVGGTTQVQIAHTASATRYITLTGSNGGQPIIDVSAGSLSLGTATSGAAIIIGATFVGGSTSAGEIVLQNNKALRSVNGAVSDTIRLIYADPSNNATLPQPVLMSSTLGVTGLTDVASTIRSTGQSAPSSGTGVEIIYSGGGYIFSINRATSAYQTLELRGLSVLINPNNGGAVATFATTGTNLSAALTYGGVTLSNAVTGTGNMALSASPTFTGTPISTTAAVGTNTTQIATTAFVSAFHQPIISSLGADVALNNTGTYFDGPSVAQGTSGTWYASGTVTLTDSATAPVLYHIKLWDGVTLIASADTHLAVTGGKVTVSMSGYLTSPAGNIRISVKDLSATTGKILFNDTGNSKDSTITAFKLVN